MYCRISVETDNHFESNAASATDKDNDTRHAYPTWHDTSSNLNPLGSSKDYNSWFETLL